MLADGSVIEQPESPNGMEEELSSSQQEIQHLKEMKNYYDNLRGALEELSSIKISIFVSKLTETQTRP